MWLVAAVGRCRQQARSLLQKFLGAGTAQGAESRGHKPDLVVGDPLWTRGPSGARARAQVLPQQTEGAGLWWVALQVDQWGGLLGPRGG